MDLLSMLKLSNIFSPQGPNPQNFPVNSIGGPSVDTGQMGNQQSSQPDLMSAIQGLLNPRDQQFQNFADLISSVPQRADYQPSKLRQISAAIAGLGSGSPVGIAGGQVVGYKSDVPKGLEVQRAINEEPYNKALTDWSIKTKPQQEIAQMEQTRNVGNRATALGTLQRTQAQEKIDAADKQNQIKNEQNQQKIDIQRAREEAYVKAKDFAQKHPEYKSFVDKDGELVLYNPTDPTSEPVPTGVKQLSQMEKIELQVQGQLNVAKVKGDISKDLENTKQGNRKDLEGVKQTNRIETKKTTSGNSAVNKPVSPSGQATAKVNKAIDIISQHPELKPYFVYGGNKKPTGELIAPKNVQEPGYLIAQRLMGESSDISLPSTNPQDQITSPSNRTLQREIKMPDATRIANARKKVEAGSVLITDGTSFGSVKPNDIDRIPAGWVVVK